MVLFGLLKILDNSMLMDHTKGIVSRKAVSTLYSIHVAKGNTKQLTKLFGAAEWRLMIAALKLDNQMLVASDEKPNCDDVNLPLVNSILPAGGVIPQEDEGAGKRKVRGGKGAETQPKKAARKSEK